MWGNLWKSVVATLINDLPAAQTVVAFSKVSWVDIAVLDVVALTNTHIRRSGRMRKKLVWVVGLIQSTYTSLAVGQAGVVERLSSKSRNAWLLRHTCYHNYPTDQHSHTSATLEETRANHSVLAAFHNGHMHTEMDPFFIVEIGGWYGWSFYYTRKSMYDMFQ